MLGVIPRLQTACFHATSKSQRPAWVVVCKPTLHLRASLDSTVLPGVPALPQHFWSGNRCVWPQSREKLKSSERLCAACICGLRFPGICRERSAPTAILHNGERARECDVSVGADSSAAHTEVTLKRFGKNLVCKKSGFITREAEHHVLQPPLKPHVCSGHGGWYLHLSGNISEHEGTPVCFQARQLDAIRPVAKVK